MVVEYDVVILGGGTGGYVAAIQAAKIGKKVAVVERYRLGGTCLHKGCIPTKAYLRSAEILTEVQNAGEFGVVLEEIAHAQIDFTQVVARKQQIVDTLEGGIAHLFKKYKIDCFYGQGSILGPSIFSPMAGTISVTYPDERENDMLVPQQLIIATGSKPKSLPGLVIDEEIILSSDGMIQLEQLPTSILIIGGGVIGMEWATLLHSFGVKVTVLEYAEQMLPAEDNQVAQLLMKKMQQDGIELVNQIKLDVTTVQINESGIVISGTVDEEVHTYSAEKMMVSVGRAANIQEMGLDNTQVMVENGFIEVDDDFRTKEKHIFAIGDCINTPQLAHVAMYEGFTVAGIIGDQTITKITIDQMSRCVYTSPEIASIGLSESQAKKQGYQVKVGRFPFSGNGKALIHGDAEGFVKVVADKESNDLLGVVIIGPHATDLIGEVALGKFLDATPWELGSMMYPHPTMSEVIGEAARAVDGQAIHM